MSLQLLTRDTTDLIHNLAATTAGTAGATALLGADAPNIGTVGGTSYYSTFGFSAASLGLAAGETFSVVSIVNTSWDGTSSGAHELWALSKTAGSNTNRLDCVASAGVLYFIVGDSGDTVYIKEGVINATNWAANINHVVICTRDSSNTIRLYLDGTELTTTTGTPRAESLINDNLKIGMAINDTNPVDAPVHTALCDRPLTTHEIAAVSNLRYRNWLSPSWIGNISRLGGTTITDIHTPLLGIDKLHHVA